MASVKFQIFRTSDPAGAPDPAVNWDYRGHGDQVGFADYHRTIPQLESDPASDEYLAEVVENGGALNKLLQSLVRHQPGWLGNLASILGLEGSGPIGLRVCIMDQ
jgi:hypothetical protein